MFQFRLQSFYADIKAAPAQVATRSYVNIQWGIYPKSRVPILKCLHSAPFWSPLPEPTCLLMRSVHFCNWVPPVE